MYEWITARRNMKRYDIINYLIKKNNYTSYLEVGTEKGENIEKIKCKQIDSIDPEKKYTHLTYEMNSDDAFEKIMKENKTYDIIFIDGLHLEYQVDKDIENSLQVLNPNGIIIVHDCLPPAKEYASDPRTREINWNGTVYKSIINLRYDKDDLFICTINTDWGCGLIKRSKKKQKQYNKVSKEKAKTWDYFFNNKKELLNIIEISDFLYDPKYKYII